MTRKSPIKHKVRAYQKQKGKSVAPYIRGKGFAYNQNGHLANPTPGYKQLVPPVATSRLLKKLGVPEWYGWGPEFNNLPSKAKKAVLAEYKREQKIINKFSSDPAKMQVELVLDHAKRLVDQEQDTFTAWNTAVQNCKYQYQGKGSLDPFGYEVSLTDEYSSKLDDYAKKSKKKQINEEEANEALGKGYSGGDYSDPYNHSPLGYSTRKS